MTTNWKRHVKSEFALFQTSSILFSFTLISFVKSWQNCLGLIESERTVSEFRKRNRKFLCCVDQLHKAGVWHSRKFHVADLQRQLRNVQKSVMHVQSCYFANINQLLFCCPCCHRHSCCLNSPLLWSRNVQVPC